MLDAAGHARVHFTSIQDLFSFLSSQQILPVESRWRSLLEPFDDSLNSAGSSVRSGERQPVLVR